MPRVVYLSGYHTLFDSFRVPPCIPTYDIWPPREDTLTQRLLLTEGRISSASPDKSINAWNEKMAPTNIMVSGSTTGQGVGEWVGTLLWWGGLVTGMAALLQGLRLIAVERKKEGGLAPQEGKTDPGEKTLREWDIRIGTQGYRSTLTGGDYTLW
ncbi:hypothetical protein DFH08DRAFT_823716 [Mycena albidolilacea]|uniref:Uncharacterized protein n=1 Tax=Mycena albidolilacea TaxID=1033008 RepID=A0AAD7EBS5_9AGAR|nr:hypothetical protein DFH08DRAFT_823716 [Mycena albidolilacea]